MRLAIVLAVTALAAPAVADKADKAFHKAKKLQSEKKYTEACPLFVDVDRADPAVGAKLNAGKCYEEWGKLASAHRWYSEAEKQATETKDERATKIKELLEELDVNVPRMTIKVPDGADPDVLDTLTLDGVPLSEDFLNSSQRVDPGAHVIEFVVDGQRKKKMAPVERGGESELSLDIPKGVGKKPRKKKPGTAEPVIVKPADPGRSRKLIGIAVGGAGVVAVGIASALTLSARSDYNAAIDEHCMGQTNLCNATGLQITHDARTTANISTVITLVGVAAIAGGVVLYLTAPKANAEQQTVYVAPSIDATGGGFVVGGSF